MNFISDFQFKVRVQNTIPRGMTHHRAKFKILYSGGFCISDSVEGYKTTFGDSVVYAESPEDFREKIDFYLNNPADRLGIAERGHKHVKENHTGFHRAATILKALGMEDLSLEVLKAYGDSLNV